MNLNEMINREDASNADRKQKLNQYVDSTPALKAPKDKIIQAERALDQATAEFDTAAKADDVYQMAQEIIDARDAICEKYRAKLPQ